MLNRIFPLLAALVFLTFNSAVNAASPTTLPVWPGDAPGEPSGIGAEHLQPPTPQRPVDRLTNVTVPTLSFYPAPADKNTGAAIVICPGGGYSILAMNLEGTEVADWLNSIGVNAFVLKYRVPGRKGIPNYLPPLQDGQRAISLVRQHAEEWKIDPKRVGMLGFSAGGNLTARASTSYETRAYTPIDDIDKISCRPDFSVLIYPAWLENKEKDENGKEKPATGLIPDLKVNAQTPPMFIVQATDDGLIEASVFMYLALKRAKVSTEMHLYAKGGHGFGLRDTGLPSATWPARCAEWMGEMKLLGPAK
jgi:acetyl esterase/lipase